MNLNEKKKLLQSELTRLEKKLQSLEINSPQWIEIAEVMAGYYEQLEQIVVLEA